MLWVSEWGAPLQSTWGEGRAVMDHKRSRGGGVRVFKEKRGQRGAKREKERGAEKRKGEEAHEWYPHTPLAITTISHKNTHATHARCSFATIQPRVVAKGPSLSSPKQIIRRAVRKSCRSILGFALLHMCGGR